MKKGILVLVVVAAVVGGMWWMGLPPFNKPAVPADAMMEKTGEPMTTNAVQIKDFAFSPQTLVVKVGDKVTWTNSDVAGHSATADDGSFDTGVIATGESGEFTPIKAGTYMYHCTPHPNMKGTIEVTE